MSTSLHAFLAPVFLRTLRNLSSILTIGEKHAAERGIAPDVLLQTRLTPDMLPLARQVQIATDMAKNACTRLTATEPVPFADDETTFAELQARIARTIAHIESFDAQAFEGGEARNITIKSRTGELNFNGLDYVTGYVLPNLYFHASIAYAILRASGVPLGKADWLGDAGR